MISFWNIKQVVVPFKGLCSTEPSYFAFGETLKSNWLARGHLRGERDSQPLELQASAGNLGLLQERSPRCAVDLDFSCCAWPGIGQQ